MFIWPFLNYALLIYDILLYLSQLHEKLKYKVTILTLLLAFDILVNYVLIVQQMVKKTSTYHYSLIQQFVDPETQKGK